jgi:hypothetical protein
MSENRKPVNTGRSVPTPLNEGEQRSFGTSRPERSERNPPTDSSSKKSNE